MPHHTGLQLPSARWRGTQLTAEELSANMMPLQASHFLSTWGQRGWEFNVGLLMLGR